MGQPATTDPLQALPNVGAEAAKWLRAAGIETPEQLAEVGSVEAALRVKAVRPGRSPCRSMLCALEGAIRGVRWHSIPKPERDALWAEFESRESECAN